MITADVDIAMCFGKWSAVLLLAFVYLPFSPSFTSNSNFFLQLQQSLYISRFRLYRYLILDKSWPLSARAVRKCIHAAIGSGDVPIIMSFDCLINNRMDSLETWELLLR